MLRKQRGVHRTGSTPLTRVRPAYDGAEPSGNSVAALNLLRLAELTTRPEPLERATRIFAAFSTLLTEAPMGSPKLLSALDFYLDHPREVVIVLAETGGDASRLLAPLRSTYLPNRVLVVCREGEQLARRAHLVPLVEEKRALAGAPTAYVCERGACELPTSEPAVFARQLARVVRYAGEARPAIAPSERR